MLEHMWSGRVLAKYWALQLMGTAVVVVVLLALARVLGWPLWIVWASTAGWMMKDALLYPLVWRSYDPSYPTSLPHPPPGAAGVAVERVDPAGRVRVSGELWHAELAGGARRIEHGAAVRVRGRRGMTLIVEPADAHHADA